MQDRRSDRPTDNIDPAVHPLKSLTPAQFAALGGSAVIFVRAIKGNDLSELLDETGFIDDADYHLVMSADGTALFVADTEEAVDDWLSEKNFGVVPLH
jgi:hypothetical protein